MYYTEHLRRPHFRHRPRPPPVHDIPVPDIPEESQLTRYKKMRFPAVCMKKCLFVGMLICLAAVAQAEEPPAPALPALSSASELSSIAAVVNDDVISSLDLENRLHMVFATTHLE